MKTFSNLNEIKNIDETVVALGNFDGLHLGHQELMKRTKEISKSRNLKASVFSFSNHPLNLLKKGNGVKNISYQSEKIKILEKLQMDYFFNIEFTNDIMTLEPEKFIKELVVDTFRAKAVVCGFNYRFGYKAQGSIEDLKKYGEKYGFTVDIIEPVIINGEVASSTLIRSLIQSGEVDEVSQFLGRNYVIEGNVVVGNKIGRTIGFPTSNITIDSSIVTPPNGVYVTNCIYNDNIYPSVTNVGTRPTIGDFEKNVETHIFDFDKELYGKNIKVEFLYKIRDEVKFKDREELKEQIKKDCKYAEKWHEENSFNVFEIIS